MTDTADLEARLALLKQRFDSAFSAPPPPLAAEAVESLLALAVGAERHFLRLRDIEGLYLERTLTSVPSRAPHMLGVTDFRGELVAVFDLAALLTGARCTRPRYLVRSSQRPVAFAFEHFQGHVRVGRQSSQDVAAAPRSTIELPVARLERELAGNAAGEGRYD